MLFFISIFTFIAFSFLLAIPASAHCPLCIAGAGIGLSLARIAGVDDSITGVWLSALLGASSFYLSAFTFRKIKFPFKKPVIYLIIFLTTLWSFYQFKLIDLHAGNVYGLPKLTYGMVSGAVIFYLADTIDAYLIKKHGRVYFPYQRMVVSLGSTLYLSMFNYILINYLI